MRKETLKDCRCVKCGKQFKIMTKGQYKHTYCGQECRPKPLDRILKWKWKNGNADKMTYNYYEINTKSN